MPQRVSPDFQTRRALLRQVAPRYQQASPAQKTLLLDAFVEWTGYSRKYAIVLLNHGEHAQQPIQRHRSSQYSQAVQQALFLSWKVAYWVCAKRLLPFLPMLVTLLEQHGHMCLTEEERRQLLSMSLSTAERFLRTQRNPACMVCPPPLPVHGARPRFQLPASSLVLCKAMPGFSTHSWCRFWRGRPRGWACAS